MDTLLILGSKPNPSLPPAGSFSHLACANASGNSAARYGLPDPTFTVMSAILTSGRKPANDLALEALRNLRTESLYLYPRPLTGGSALRRGLNYLKTYRMRSFYLRRTLRSVGYRCTQFNAPPLTYYLDLMKRLCDQDAGVLEQMERKLPSTGMVALALGLADGRFSRQILSGFSFEITHAYAVNPLIGESGTTQSKHAGTDIAVLNALSRKFGTIFTTEPIVSERTAIPMLPEALSAARASGTAASH